MVVQQELVPLEVGRLASIGYANNNGSIINTVDNKYQPYLNL